MANGSAPRPGVSAYASSAARGAAYDAGLRSYMLSVYNYMASGVLLTGIVALLFAKSGMVGSLYSVSETGRASMSGLGWIVALAPLAIVMVMSFGQSRIATGTLQLLFWAYALLMGLSLSTLFLVYTDASISNLHLRPWRRVGDADRDAAAGLRIFASVDEDVGKNLQEPSRVCHHEQVGIAEAHLNL